MSDFGEVLVSRSDIARLAGVRRPAVTNWQRRHSDFPAPVPAEAGSAEPEAFRAREVLDWLADRAIPSNALEPREPAGTTYGDRFRAGLRGDGGRSGSLLAAVDQLAKRDADRLRGQWRMSGYLYLLLFLVFVQGRDGHRWSDYVRDPRRLLIDLDVRVPDEPSHVHEIIRFIDSNPPASPDESRQAFERLLGQLRDSDAREADEYYTPPSVSRVMARSLVGHGPAARRLYDPFCRSGELLCAYLEAVSEQGGKQPADISGRGPGEMAQRLARMNLELHGIERPRILEGPRAPAQEPGDFGGLSGSFDAVITNPPFGSWGPWPQSPPTYWRYGMTRSREFDWLQYVASCLAPGGRAAVLMPAGAGFRGSAERETRARMVEDGVIECVMALPPQLFELTAIQTHVWFLRSSLGHPEKVLFVDGTGLGSMASRTRRALSDADTDRFVQAYVSWRDAGHPGTPGFSRAAGPEEVAAQDYRLEPALYVRDGLPSAGTADDPAVARDRLAKLSEALDRLHEQARTIDRDAELRLRRYGL
ncbi:N-6 DNA methylase [Streptomyces sp. NPDC054813]